MSFDYEKFYTQSPHGLGKPTDVFVDFFAKYERKNVSVLDVGCGQGRDALFIARLGHRVTAMDLSPTGIAQLAEDALAENLEIETVVADVCDFVPTKSYDVILIDRTLHMLEKEDQIEVLRRLLLYTVDGGLVLIADEKSNMPHLKQVIAESDKNWTGVLDTGGYFFVKEVV